VSTAVPVAEALNVSKRFGATVALENVSLQVMPGEAHALVGRNGAGKSTLVSLLTGLARPDSGRIRFDGHDAPAASDPVAWRSHVACVYQKSTIIPGLSVAENLYLNRQSGLISWKSLRAQARRLLAQWEIDVDPAVEARTLTVEQQQTVEIARALSFGARFIILDEPTAQLDAAGISRLVARLAAMRAAGVAFLFISHHLQEVYDTCQTVTVLRDARHVVTAPVDSLGHDALVEAMTGDIGSVAPPRSQQPDIGEPVLELDDVDGVSLTVHRGEIVGIAGAGGSGAVALGETVVGLRRPRTGRIRVSGAQVRAGSVPAGLAAGIGFVPEDRHREGLIPLRSVAENLTLTADLGVVISGRARDDAAAGLMHRLDVKAGGPHQRVSALSGGNQQKVVMGRALASRPKVLVLLRPTAGVDVRSKQSLLSAVQDEVAAGGSALIVSDEIDDLRTADRVLVMFHGRVTAEFDRDWTDTQLVAAMEGLEDNAA
jgi:simple sugar transport system ATP-binding protein